MDFLESIIYSTLFIEGNSDNDSSINTSTCLVFVAKENMSRFEYCNEYEALLICIIGKEIVQKNKENSVLH